MLTEDELHDWQEGMSALHKEAAGVCSAYSPPLGAEAQARTAAFFAKMGIKRREEDAES